MRGQSRQTGTGKGIQVIRSVLKFISVAFLCGQSASAHHTANDQALITYDMAIAGIPVGWAAVEFTVGDTGDYRVDFGLKFEFLFWRGGAAGGAMGKLQAGTAKPRVSDVTVIPEGSEPVGMWEIFEGNRVKHWSISPGLDEKYVEGCVPVQEADIQDALDPLSALIIAADSAAEACSRKLPVFVVGTRFDLNLTPERPLEQGVYSCAVSYKPVSGHRETSESVGILLSNNPELTIFEVSPGLWAPHSVSVPTRFGSLSFSRRMR